MWADWAGPDTGPIAERHRGLFGALAKIEELDKVCRKRVRCSAPCTENRSRLRRDWRSSS